MKLISLIVAKQGTSKVVVLSKEYNLKGFGFFEKKPVRESCIFLAREILPLLQGGAGSNSINHEEYCAHVFSEGNGLSFVAVCDEEYPPRVAFDCLRSVMEEFILFNENNWKTVDADADLNFPSLKNIIIAYENPADVDPLFKAQKQVDQIHEVMSHNLNTLLEKQENIDELVSKSEDLSKQSKMFYKGSKKMKKRCCIIF
mmetsp:Transcript_34008/g.38646  ORF Transcript_34008/g.38646 Transcript_34008/m.38646 type:complete len:201 (-) Transcript_34008:113-715(-)